MKNKKLISFILSLLMMIPLVSCNNKNPLSKEMPDDFSFSLVWSVFGKSSYNSETGELVKSKFEPEEELYKTTCFLTQEELLEVYNILLDANVNRFDEFKDWEFNSADPAGDYQITISTGAFEKTIKAPYGTYIDDGANSLRANKFIEVMESIIKIVKNTDEWKAMPDETQMYF